MKKKETIDKLVGEIEKLPREGQKTMAFMRRAGVQR